MFVAFIIFLCVLHLVATVCDEHFVYNLNHDDVDVADNKFPCINHLVQVTRHLDQLNIYKRKRKRG